MLFTDFCGPVFEDLHVDQYFKNYPNIMKTILLSAILTVGLAVAAWAQTASVAIEKAGAGNMAGFQWNETTHDFGKIGQGKPVSTDFIFTNTGKAPLTISQVRGSCGCTVTNYTKEPVLPGKTGKVSAIFNAASPGPFNKSISVTANVEGGAETLFIKGEVLRPGAAVQAN